MREIKTAMEKLLEDMRFRLSGLEDIGGQLIGKPQAEVEAILREEIMRRLVGLEDLEFLFPKKH
jgi:hypothetical protein